MEIEGSGKGGGATLYIVGALLRDSGFKHQAPCKPDKGYEQIAMPAGGVRLRSTGT